MTQTDWKPLLQRFSEFINLAHFKKQSKSHIPASIVVTKWDESEDFGADDENKRALEYIEKNEHLNKAYVLIKSNFEYVNIVPVSAYEKHNLLKPIEFSLKHTFDKWYMIAKEYESKKEDDKLIKFLAKWYENINIDTLNETYPFNDIYKEVQHRYVAHIMHQLDKIETLGEKEEYLNKVVDFYKTEKKLLLPLKEEIEQAKRKEKRQKSLINLAAIAGVAIAVYLGLSIYSKFKVDESYRHIIAKADQNTTSYQDIKEEIEGFMYSYNPKSMLYIFSGLVEKRSNIQKLGVNLESRDKKYVENSISRIMSDQTLTPDEKQRELSSLLIYSTDTQKINLEQIISNLQNENLTKIWKEEVERCLKNCKDGKGISTIEELLSQVKNSEYIIHDQEVEEKIAALNEKEREIKDNIGFEELYTEIDRLRSLDAIIDFLNKNRKWIDYNNQQIKSKIVAKTTKVNKDYYATEKGKELVGELNYINDINETIKYMKGDLKKFVDRKKSYYKIKNDIEITEKYGDLDKIDYNNFSNLVDGDKINIKRALKEKLLAFFKEIKNNPPSDKNDIKAKEIYYSKMGALLEFSVTIGGEEYKLTLSDNELTQIEEDKKDIQKHLEVIERLKDNGVFGVQVKLKMLDDENSLGFGCDWNSDEQITITGFGSDKLTYDNKDTVCNDDDVMIFGTRIALKTGNYKLTLVSHSGPNRKIQPTINLTIDDLKKLKDKNPVPKLIDNNKLKLIFIK